MKMLQWMLCAAAIMLFSNETPAASAQSDAKESLDRYLDVVYTTVEQGDQSRELKLDIFIPRNAKKPVPLVVWIHGGAWMVGDKRPCASLFMTEHGFAAASIGYRLYPEAIFPAQIHDCKAAIRFLRANAEKYGIDPNAIGVWGASAGGHLAAMLGVSAGNEQADGTLGDYTNVSTRVQAVCSWFGPMDFFTMPLGRRQFQADRDPETLLLGGRLSEKQDLARLVSPISHVSKDDPPFLFMHGNRDTTVPLQQSRLMHEMLTAAGVPSELIVLKGEGHGFRDNQAAAQKVLQFFKRQLQDKPKDKIATEE
jgi:acetyl esterase/lipase